MVFVTVLSIMKAVDMMMETVKCSTNIRTVLTDIGFHIKVDIMNSKVTYASYLIA